MDRPKFRWGILGTAHIARKNWKAIHNTQNGIVAAVASRDQRRSQQFIAECQADVAFPTVPRALGSYEELIGSADVDGLYIPLPTGIRKEWVLRAAAAGKHVVCEKPCAVSMGDLREMVSTCRRHQVQFMDGVMFMHSQRLEAIREALNESKTIGPIKRINCVFNFNAPEEFFKTNIRVNSALEPYGCLGDLGWYCIRFILWAMNWQLPGTVSGRMLAGIKGNGSPKPVATEFSGELFFEGGVSSSFYCSFITDLQQTAQISGSGGCLELRDFVLPFFGCESTFETWNPVHQVRGCDFNLEPNHRRWSTREYSNSHPTAQETNLFRNFVDQVRTGQLHEGWTEMALHTQQVMEACHDSALVAIPAHGLRGRTA
jgi:predicted dehydrogenase